MQGNRPAKLRYENCPAECRSRRRSTTMRSAARKRSDRATIWPRSTVFRVVGDDAVGRCAARAQSAREHPLARLAAYPAIHSSWSGIGTAGHRVELAGTRVVVAVAAFDSGVVARARSESMRLGCERQLLLRRERWRVSLGTFRGRTAPDGNRGREQKRKTLIPQGFSRRKVATLMGLEPTTSAVTGRRSNQLSYNAKPVRGSWRLRRFSRCGELSLVVRVQTMVGTVGIEPTTPRV